MTNIGYRYLQTLHRIKKEKNGISFNLLVTRVRKIFNCLSIFIGFKNREHDKISTIADCRY